MTPEQEKNIAAMSREDLRDELFLEISTLRLEFGAAFAKAWLEWRLARSPDRTVDLVRRMLQRVLASGHAADYVRELISASTSPTEEEGVMHYPLDFLYTAIVPGAELDEADDEHEYDWFVSNFESLEPNEVQDYAVGFVQFVEGVLERLNKGKN